MPRPNYPQPSVILIPGMIGRIRQEQELYDDNPELSEQIQREQERTEQEIIEEERIEQYRDEKRI